MKYLSMLVRLDEGELVRAEDGGWLEELEVIHFIGLGEVHHPAWLNQGGSWCLGKAHEKGAGV